MGSAIVLVCAFRDPAPLSITTAELDAPPRPALATQVSVTRPLDDFAPLWQRRLGAPLNAPLQISSPRKRRTTTKRNKNRVQRGLRLIGTVLETGRSVAMFADANGNIHLRSVGDTLDMDSGSAQVDRIELEQVTLLLDESTLVLEMQ